MAGALPSKMSPVSAIMKQETFLKFFDRLDENGPQGGRSPQGTAEKNVSATDPDCGMFVKGEHERQLPMKHIRLVTKEASFWA